MADFKIYVDLSPLLEVTSSIGGAVMPLVRNAVSAVAERAHFQWTDGIKQASLWKGMKDPYMASLQWKMNGDYSAVVWSDYEKASEIENGMPARDLKDMLNTSMKVADKGWSSIPCYSDSAQYTR